jgi:hypothetical protein
MNVSIIHDVQLNNHEPSKKCFHGYDRSQQRLFNNRYYDRLHVGPYLLDMSPGRWHQARGATTCDGDWVEEKSAFFVSIYNVLSV